MDRPRVDHALGPSGTSTRYKIGLALTLTPDFDSGIDRSLQEIIDLVFLIIGRNNLMGWCNSRRELVRMPMAELWQSGQRSAVGFGINRYIE
jgi:hypothetical protein